MIKIAIIGCGNMGIAYAKSFLKYEVANRESLVLVEKNESQAEKLRAMNLGRVVPAIEKEHLSTAEVVILAVKPQDFGAIAPLVKNALNGEQLVLSIMAGVTMEKIATLLSHNFVVRAMPNTPAQVGMGVTAYVASPETSLTHIRKVEKLLSTTGREILVDDEALLDAVTAISGSGPAYFFYFLKAMIEAGREMGLDEAMAALLVKQTMLGSYHLMNNAEKSLDELIASVKSKGGTTEAALNKFDEHSMANIVKEALGAAQKRAKELSSMV